MNETPGRHPYQNMKTVTDKQVPQESSVAFLSKRLWRAALQCMFLGVVAMTPATVQAACDGTSFHSIGAEVKNDNPDYVHIGDTVNVTGWLRNDSDDCDD